MIPLRDSQPSRSTPVVTLAIIAVNVLIFLYEFSLDPYSLNFFIHTYGMVPANFELPTLVTSIFLHGGWMHLIGNMWFLWIYGDNVEDVMGHGRYLLFYLLSGIAAALLQFAISPGSRIPTVGASGAIAGVMGAYMVKFPRARITTLVILFVFVTTVEIPALLILLYWFVIQFFSGVGAMSSAQGEQGGVAWFAHIGGFVAGIVLLYVLGSRERYSHRRDLSW